MTMSKCNHPPVWWMASGKCLKMYGYGTGLVYDQWHSILFDVIINSPHKALIKQCWKAI